jgi:hypothetical protein
MRFAVEYAAQFLRIPGLSVRTRRFTAAIEYLSTSGICPGFTMTELRTLQKSNIHHTGAVMKNIEMKVEGSILTITVDLSKEFGPSASGKTIIIASTEGNVSIPDAEEKKIGLNIYKKPER